MTNHLPLRINRLELSYHQKAFFEQCQLLGRRCFIYPPIERHLSNTTTSDTYVYDESRKYEYYILLQSDPPRKILELFGFSKESTDTKPLIAHCPFYRTKTKEELRYEDIPPDTSYELIDNGEHKCDNTLDIDEYTFALGTITSIDNKSDGYPRNDIVRFMISEGCKLVIDMNYDDDPNHHSFQSYTVEKVVNTEDDSYVLVQLVPERTKSLGVEYRKDQGDSGSRYIFQDDDYVNADEF